MLNNRFPIARVARLLGLVGIAGLLAIAPRPALALINLTYTPVNLVRDSKWIVLLEVAPPEKDQIIGRVVATLNGDAAEDMLAVDSGGNVGATLGAAPRRQPLGLTVALPAKTAGPVTVTAFSGNRRTGMYVVRAGMPAYIGRETKGAVRLEWAEPDGKKQTRQITVLKMTRVEL